MFSEERRYGLERMAEGRRGQGRIVRVKGGGKIGDLVNAANGAQASLTNGLSTMRGALTQVAAKALAVGRDDIAKAIASNLSDIEQAEEELRSVLLKLRSPSDVRVESDEESGVPAVDGKGPHGAGMGPRAKGRKVRKEKCQRAQRSS